MKKLTCLALLALSWNAIAGDLGDYAPATNICGKFSTFRPSTGAAFTLGGTPALSVYKDNSTTQSTTGITLTADFDAVTGLNHYCIDTSADGTFYAAGSNFDVVITTGTVDSVSVVGAAVGSFRLNKESALKPATAGRTLLVSAAGASDANVTQFGGSNGTFSGGRAEVNVSHWHGSDLLTGTGPLAGLGVLDRGTAQSDSTTSLRLRDALTYADDEPNGATALIYSATTGAGQRSAISDYVGSTDTATLGTTLPTDPTGTVRYEIYGTASASGTLTANVTQVEGTDATDYFATLDDSTLARLPAALVSGRMDASVGAMAADVMTAAAAASDFGTELGTATWASTTRLLTAGTNIVLAKGTGITGFNDLSAVQVNTEVDTAIVDARLDELLAGDSDIDGLAPPTVGSVFHELMTSSAASFTFAQATDSLEAIRDNLAGGAADWTADERTAIKAILGVDGTATPADPSAGILDTIRDYVDTEVATLVTNVGTPTNLGGGSATLAGNLQDIEAQTDDIGVAGAGLTATDDAVMTRLGAPAGASMSADIAAIEDQTDDIGVAGAGLTAVDDAVLAAIEQTSRADAVVFSCEVNTANFAGSTTTVACIVRDRNDNPITSATDKLEGRELLILSGAQAGEGRFITGTTWDAGNSELQLTLSRALPGTLADAVTALIR